MASLKNFSQTMLLSILYPTTITINSEAYVPSSDTYTEKRFKPSTMRLDKLTSLCASSLLERHDRDRSRYQIHRSKADPKEYLDRTSFHRGVQEP